MIALQVWVLRSTLHRLFSLMLFWYAICVFLVGVSRRVLWMLPGGLARRVVEASWKLPGGLSSQAELSFRRGLNSRAGLSRGLPPNETVNVLDS
jgi:hypothetical protein